MSENLSLRYNVRFQTHDAVSGELIEERWIHNLALTAGKRKLLDASSAKYIKDFSYVSVGTGSTAPDAADTALVTEIARAQATASNPSADILQQQVTFPAGTAIGTVSEGGLSLQDITQDSGTVATVTDATHFTVGSNSHATGYYNGGWATFTSGANAGQRAVILTSTLSSGAQVIVLSGALTATPSVGDNVQFAAAESNPTLLARTLLGTPVTWAGGSNLTVTWQIQFS